MLSKCANPSCSNQFLYLHRGKLFRADLQATSEVGAGPASPQAKKPPRRAEYYWLCEDCASTMTLVLEQGTKVKTRSLARVRVAAGSS